MATQARVIKPAAGPGPTGWRNSYIQLIHAEPAGPEALLHWAQAWAQGSFEPWAARIWTAAIARPSYKDDDLTKIRPVLCSEALVKFAFGILVRRSDAALRKACGPTQFALARASGAAIEIAEVRAAAAAYPERPLLSLDVKNAFGAARWVDVLEQTLAHTPRLAKAVAATWADGAQDVHTAQADRTWRAFPIRGSLMQGNLVGSPLFCLLLAHVQRAVMADPRLAHARSSIRHWQYVDDWILQCRQEDAALLLD